MKLGRARACALGAALYLFAASTALAHVTVTPGEAPADSYVKLTFSVPHGCEGSATTRLRVSIPEGVVSVKPQVVPGWEITTITDTYAAPVMLHGAPVEAGVTEVSWEGGPLADAYLEEFGVSVHVPDQAGEGLIFPVIQECEDGETGWIEVAEGDEEPEHPAPVLLLVAPSAEPTDEPEAAAESTAHTHEDGEEHDESAEAHVDDYGFSLLTGAAFIMGAAGMVLGVAALMAVRSRS